MRLVSSPGAQSLYRSLGFVSEESWGLELMEKKWSYEEWTVGRVIRANDEQLEAALNLEGEAFIRGQDSCMDIQNEMPCYVITGENETIDAALWVHNLAPRPSNGEVNTWIGPTIARSADLMKELVQGAMAHWAQTQEVNNLCGLVVRTGGNGTAKIAFEQLGFVTSLEYPFMRKPLRGELNQVPAPNKLVFAIHNYYGT